MQFCGKDNGNNISIKCAGRVGCHSVRDLSFLRMKIDFNLSQQLSIKDYYYYHMNVEVDKSPPPQEQPQYNSK